MIRKIINQIYSKYESTAFEQFQIIIARDIAGWDKPKHSASRISIEYPAKYQFEEIALKEFGKSEAVTADGANVQQ